MPRQDIFHVFRRRNIKSISFFIRELTNVFLATKFNLSFVDVGSSFFKLSTASAVVFFLSRPDQQLNI